jgi:hypothetical protein
MRRYGAAGAVSGAVSGAVPVAGGVGGAGVTAGRVGGGAGVTAGRVGGGAGVTAGRVGGGAGVTAGRGQVAAATCSCVQVPESGSDQNSTSPSLSVATRYMAPGVPASRGAE